MRSLTVSPVSVAGRTVFIQGSPAPEFASGTAVNVASRVGRGGTVTVGMGVSVGVAVSVAVGMAAWVSAIIVKAAAAIVFCMSATLTVGMGVACAPQALMISVLMSTRVRIEKRFM
jgi:hypothetical protein